MSKVYPLVPLNQLLTRKKEEINIQELNTYTRITIKMNGQGITIRDCVLGSEIGTKKQFIARYGQLILSKIDARNGAFGILPNVCDGAIITGNFWAFEVNHKLLDIQYFDYLTKTLLFIDFCVRASDGTTNRLYLQESKFLSMEIPLPSLEEQRQIVARVEELVGKIEKVRSLRNEIIQDSQKVLLSAYYKLIEGAEYLPMKFVAPLERRAIEINLSNNYPELGIRSFGKGTFHKPALSGAEVGTKKLFRIEANDLLFQIVFAWEGAVAVAQSKDNGRFGSHRFLTCVPQPGIATSSFLCFHFLTEKGLEDLGKASPGGAGRNRTLGLKALENIQVPIPLFEKQLWFDDLQTKIDTMKQLREEAIKELDALLPSILDKAFKGEL
ncbi:restriction endonuclease subunit S [Sphaerospermopsis torques-reginae]|uniref:Restriction endonuclease subunit S n=1 Tax=Sphaerospermopsis torques-reginae ITEP-024 TaxID=984208 RepID=A0ABX8X029_9CYAN|nr:restriction endonuclease subunit S [Sphaerospermopsis torques-reginae]QYX32046.1 restriction endonuclease subunit S [Sphaerospermopsis torques-reginae ITEP-024]